MKKALAFIVIIALVCSFCGCSRHNRAYMPGEQDFLSVNTVTGLLNRYETVFCFEKCINTVDGKDLTRSWQFHQGANGEISQVMVGDAVTLYYNRFLFESPDNGETVTYSVYLDEDVPTEQYFTKENLFGQESGAVIAFLDEKEENFRFTSTLVLDEATAEDYALWGAEAGDEIIGMHTVAKDDLRILKSEQILRRDGKDITIAASAWTYMRALQLHDVWNEYKNAEDRKLVTIEYGDDEKRLYYFPDGVVPHLLIGAEHQLFMDAEGTEPYVEAPITEPITVYYK